MGLYMTMSLISLLNLLSARSGRISCEKLNCQSQNTQRMATYYYYPSLLGNQINWEAI